MLKKIVSILLIIAMIAAVSSVSAVAEANSKATLQQVKELRISLENKIKQFKENAKQPVTLAITAQACEWYEETIAADLNIAERKSTAQWQ